MLKIHTCGILFMIGEESDFTWDPEKEKFINENIIPDFFVDSFNELLEYL